MAHLRAATDRALQEARALIAGLSTSQEEPLQDLVDSTARTFRSRYGVRVDLDVDEDLEIDRERRTALLRILQEALNNAVRHGSARRIGVRLGRENGTSVMRVHDDGSGFDPAGRSDGFGLVSMRERAELLGGALDVVAVPGRGTRVEVRLP